MSVLYQGNNGHSNSLQVGMEFQDFICEQLVKSLGLVVSIYSSRSYQLKGESIQGIEIKYDARSTGCDRYSSTLPTGNVAIELAEKQHASHNNWIPSGIYRNDNSWLYIVGNYHQAWIFGKSHLKLLHTAGLYYVNELPTLRSMLMPISAADKYCVHKLVFA